MIKIYVKCVCNMVVQVVGSSNVGKEEGFGIYLEFRIYHITNKNKASSITALR